MAIWSALFIGGGEERPEEAVKRAVSMPEVVYVAPLEQILDVPERVAAIITACRDPDVIPSPSDKACRWCLAKGECGAHASYQTMRDVDWFTDLTQEDTTPAQLPAVLPRQEVLPLPTTLGTSQLAQVVERSETFNQWLEAITDELKTRMLQGEQVDGFKVVAATTREKYADEEAAYKWLSTHRVGKEVYLNEPKLRTPNQIRKALKDKGVVASVVDAFEELVVRPEGAPVVVPLSDRRPPLVVASSQFDMLDSLPNT